MTVTSPIDRPQQSPALPVIHPPREPDRVQSIDTTRRRPSLNLIAQERDLYLSLLGLSECGDLATFAREALRLVIGITGVPQGFLELHDLDDPTSENTWAIAEGFSGEDVDTIRQRISRGIIAEALATGQVIETPSALLDSRFGDRGSVQSRKIEAVLCAPIGTEPPMGTIYLQGPALADPFPEAAKRAVVVFAKHLAPLACRLIERNRHVEDLTAPFRRQLRMPAVVGRSAALAHVLKQIVPVAPLDATVLFTGESGTGKSQMAQVIHDNSPRARGPLITVNCAALPEALVESELFGALPGAHSTAVRAMPGKVAAADGGTLFLDEIGELPMGVQAKLLQFLNSREFFPLGGAKTQKADVRLIAATNVDLEAGMREGRIREDLYYRINVIPIRMPSLRERAGDLRELSAFFCNSACERYGLPFVELSPGSLRVLETREWPGNVRQLSNAIEAAVIRASGDHAAQVGVHHLDPHLDIEPDESPGATFHDATRAFQRQLLIQTLTDAGWNVSEAARRLDLARSHVNNLITAFGLRRANTKGGKE